MKRNGRVVLLGVLCVLIISICVPSGMAQPFTSPLAGGIPQPFFSPLGGQGGGSEIVPMAWLPQVSRLYDPAVLEYGRKGVTGQDNSGGLLDYDVYHSWWHEVPGDQRKLARAINCPLEYDSRWAEAAAEDAGVVKERVWLIGNEVDLRWGHLECGVQLYNGIPINEQPEAFAHLFLMVVDAVKAVDPTAKTYCCGLVSPGESYSLNWHNRFLAELYALGRIDELDGIHVHAHPCCVRYCPDPKHQDWCWPVAQAGLEEFINYIPLDIPVWISEIGCWNWCGEASFDCIEDVMVPFLEWFNAPDQFGYSVAMWYVTHEDEVYGHPCTFLLTEEGALTDVGEAWNAW